MNISAPKPDAPTAEQPWTVARIAASLRDYIDRLGAVWVEGEITQWSISAGNVYGRLKDLNQDATVSFTIWSSTLARVTGTFKQGDRVKVLAKANYWVKGGSLNFILSDIRKAGLGDLLERIEKLRSDLRAEGLFNPEHKKPLPFLPNTIGLITARDSDAEKDVIRNAQLRWPNVEFRPVYAAVQGERVVQEVLSALETLEADPDVDVIIIARGGGDFQNLLGFSDERIIRAVFAANTPVVSAIGHEADRPILDDVADLRASTPTDAAKRVVPDVSEELIRIRQAKNSIWTIVNQRIGHEVTLLEHLRSRPALADPRWIVDQRTDELIRMSDRSREIISRQIERAELEQLQLLSNLRALSPQSTLERGYSIIQTVDGHVIFDSGTVSSGEHITVTLKTGRLDAEVTKVERVESAS